MKTMNRWLIFSILLLPLAAAAAVAKLEFVPPARGAAPGVISEKITVQTQTADGQSETIGQTADATFKSSSPTGEFLNESGDPVKITWNSNWANRTFYYRDSNVGNYTLTITVVGRDGESSWTASQTITIGQAATPPPPSPDPEPEPPPTPSVVESPPPPPTTQPAQPESTNAVISRPIAPAPTSSLTVVVPAPLASSLNADASAAELTRLGNELALAAAKLQMAQKETPRETKLTTLAAPAESKVNAELAVTSTVENANLVAAAFIEIPKPPSFFQRLADIPRKIWKLVKNLFHRS